MKKAVSIAGIAANFLVPLAAFAQLIPPSSDNLGINEIGDIRDVLLCGVLRWIYTAAIIVGVIYILIAAYKYITAGGEAEKVSGAHKALTYAAIGIAVAILAYGVPVIIFNFVSGTAGVSFGTICP